MTSKRNVLSRRSFIGLVGMMSGAVLAACTAGPTPAPTGAPTQAVEATGLAPTNAAEATEAATPAGAVKTAEEILTPLGLMPGSPNHAKGWKTVLPDIPAGMPLNPPVTVTCFARTDAATKFQGNDSIYDNISLRHIKAVFGIQYKVLWTHVTEEELAQKMNLAMAAGDLPDFMPGIGLPIFQGMLEADLAADITDAFEAAASPKWVKEPLEYNKHMLWEYAEVNGRKMAWPLIAQAAQDEQELWIHLDWLDKVGMDIPKTLDEMEAVAEAFVKNDLGAGPKGSTQGVMASRDLQSWYGGLGPVFGGFGVLPSWGTDVSTFTPDGQGGLVFNSILPAMKDALALIRRWYQKKIIAPDFYTKGYEETSADGQGNRVGMLYTHPWGGVTGTAMGSIQNDPNARWGWADVPAGPVRKGKNYYSPLSKGVMVFKKGFQHVDKVITEANFEAEILLSPERRNHGFEGYNYKWNGDKVELLQGGTADYGLVWSPSGHQISPEWLKKRIEFNENYRKTVPREQWDAYMELVLEDPTGLQPMKDEAQIWQFEHSLTDTIKNEWTGLPTTLQREKWSGLQKLTDETFFAIITGQAPLDSFDEYVQKWKSQGGDDITKELNEWYAKKQKQ